MTEEVIIDGIDVSEWDLKGVLIPITECKYFEGIGGCKETRGLCVANDNCYYKQLKRLEQEKFALTQESQQKSQTICELEQDIKQLTQWLDKARNNADFWCNKCTNLEQENNSLQAQLNNVTVQSNNVITALEQENKELKEKIQFHNKENSHLLAERNAAQIGYDETREVKEHYRSALEEIKKDIQNWINSPWSCFNCRNNMDERLTEIQNKINEVLTP